MASQDALGNTSFDHLENNKEQAIRKLEPLFKTIFVMVFMMATKLDTETRELWEQRVVELPRTDGRQTIPDAELIPSFIDQRARTLEHSQHLKLGPSSAPSKKVTGAAVTGEVATSNYTANNKVKPKPIFKTRTDQIKVAAPARVGLQKCSHCGADHKLWIRDTSKALTHEDKKATIFRAKLCFNCLNSGHQTRACTSKYSCKTCKSKHHTLMHAPVPPTGSS